MTNLKDLDPETRCYALVGQFLQCWSEMEFSLQKSIGDALNVEDEKLLILSANLRFRDKTNVLRTLVDVAHGFTDAEKTEKKKKLHDLAEYSSSRNMVAHDRFGPDPSETGVRFYTVKAKGTYSVPDIVWTQKEFNEARARVVEFRHFLDDLANRFKSKPLSQEDYANVFRPFVQTDWPVPIRRTMSSDLMNLLSQTPTPLRDPPKTAPDESNSG